MTDEHKHKWTRKADEAHFQPCSCSAEAAEWMDELPRHTEVQEPRRPPEAAMHNPH